MVVGSRNRGLERSERGERGEIETDGEDGGRRECGERGTMETSSQKAYATFDELREVEKRNNECPRADDSSAARENEERE